MSVIPFSLGAYKRSGFPESVTVNVLSEPSPTKGGTSLIARPGLEEFDTVGTAPLRCMFAKAGLFDDAALILANDTVITLDAGGMSTTLTGTVSGDDLVDIDGQLDADGNAVAYIANGTGLYTVTGGSVSLDPYTGSGAASSVQCYKGYVLTVDAVDKILRWLDIAGTTWSALNFAGADYGPDALVGVRVFGELFALLGSATTEIWRATGDATAELAPYGGLNFDVGCRALQTAVNCGGVLIWVDHLGGVRMCAGGEAQLISDEGLTEQIESVEAADLRASFFVKDGHACYVLRLGSVSTWVYDLSTKRWVRFDSLGYDYWRAHLLCNLGDTVLAADSLSNQVWRMDPDLALDGDDTFTCQFTAFVPGRQPLASVELVCEQGDAPLTGQGSDPLAWLQVSKDGAKTWGSQRYRSLGATGEHTKRTRWNALGEARVPLGAWLKFGVSDPVRRRFHNVLLNEPL